MLAILTISVVFVLGTLLFVTLYQDSGHREFTTFYIWNIVHLLFLLASFLYHIPWRSMLGV